MQENRDYDIAIAKIPRKDKKGNDITKDKLAGGGRHREDGTISGMAYDFEILDEERFLDADREEKIPEYSAKDMLMAFLVENLLVPVVECFFDELEYHAEMLFVDKVFPAVKKKGKDLLANVKPVILGIRDGLMGKETRAEQIFREHEKKKTEMVASIVS